MAGSYNKATIVGNLGSDPDVRSTGDGRPVVNLSVATGERWKDKQTGEMREHTDWHRIVIFNEGLCGIAEKYLRKGSKVLIEGAIKTRKWTDQAGVEKYITEIVLGPFNATLVLLDKAERAPGPETADYGQASAPRGERTADAKSPARRDEMDDEILF